LLFLEGKWHLKTKNIDLYILPLTPSKGGSAVTSLYFFRKTVFFFNYSCYFPCRKLVSTSPPSGGGWGEEIPRNSRFPVEVNASLFKMEIPF